MFVIPREPTPFMGRRTLIPAEGAVVEETAYYQRLIKSGAIRKVKRRQPSRSVEQPAEKESPTEEKQDA